MNEYEIYEQAVKHYGHINQIVKSIEECGELIQALARWLEGAPDIGNIAEEIADVEIMIEQIKIMLNSWFKDCDAEKLLNLRKYEKVSRLAVRLGMEKYTEEENA